jgi:hypothetical protein
MGDGVPFAEWTGELLYRARLSWKDGAEAKASLKRAKVCCRRPETEWSTHVQGEAEVMFRGGPNRPTLKSRRMTCG